MLTGTVNGYTLVKEIGSGQFGKVMLAKDAQGMQFAIKIIPLPNLQRDPNLRTFLAKETGVLLRLTSPHIIEFIEEFESSGLLFIVYEYCDKGSLDNSIRASGGLNEEAALLIFRDVLLAIAELEGCGIVHRDIKPENILMKATKVKLADFGLSLQGGKSECRLVGSPIYMAPEALERFEYTTKGDIYALGVTLFKMLTNSFPFFDKDFNALLIKKKMMTEDQLPQAFSWQLRHLLFGCLNPQPALRMGVAELLGFLEREFGFLRQRGDCFPSKRHIQTRPSVGNSQLKFLSKKAQSNPLHIKFNPSLSENQIPRQILREVDGNKQGNHSTCNTPLEQFLPGGVPFSRRLSNQKSPLMKVYQDKSQEMGQSLPKDAAFRPQPYLIQSNTQPNYTIYPEQDHNQSFTIHYTAPAPLSFHIDQGQYSYRPSSTSSMQAFTKQTVSSPHHGYLSPTWKNFRPN